MVWFKLVEPKLKLKDGVLLATAVCFCGLLDGTCELWTCLACLVCALASVRLSEEIITGSFGSVGAREKAAFVNTHIYFRFCWLQRFSMSLKLISAGTPSAGTSDGSPPSSMDACSQAILARSRSLSSLATTARSEIRQRSPQKFNKFKVVLSRLYLEDSRRP